MKNHVLRSFAASLVLVAALVFSPLASAVPVDVFSDCKANGGATVCGGSSSGIFTVIRNIIEILLIVAGIVAVIMIIIGGIRYITSNGRDAEVKGAKDTIFYSVIGLIITLLAYAIVKYVVGNLN